MQYSKEQLIKIATIVSAIGAINWLLASLDFNVINRIVGNGDNDLNDISILERSIYFAVGISGVYLLYNLFNIKLPAQKMKVYYF
jgi:uncharacterized membrane protein YuzA (DUF378 family)